MLRFKRNVSLPSAEPPRRAPSGRSSTASAGFLIAGLVVMAVISSLLIVLTGYFSVLLIVMLCLVGLLMYDFRIAAGALMVFIPLASTNLLPSFKGLNAQNLLLFGGIASYALYRIGHKVNYRLVDRKLLLCYLIPFLLVGLVGSNNAHTLAQLSGKTQEAVADRKGFLLYYVLKPALLIAMAWLIGAATRHLKDPRRLITVFAFGAIVPAAFIVVYIPASGVSLSQLVNFRSFLSALGMHSNQFAVALNFSIATTLFAGLVAPSSGRRLFLLSVAAFLSVTLLFTFSRGGYVGLMIILIAYMVYYRDGSKLLIGLLVLAIGAFFIPDAVIERATLGVTHGSEQDLSSGRVHGIWLPLLPKVLDAPIFGHGLMYVGRSDLVAGGRMMVVGQAHNAYLDLLLDSGIVGLVLVLLFLYSAFRDFRTLAVSDPDPLMQGFFRGASIGMMAWLVQAFTDDRLFPNQPQMMFWMAYGVMLGRHPRMLKQVSQKLARRAAAVLGRKARV
ncbi:O-antigen ligase family protein [Ideonella sp. BN130291]|uniref:O-antigen ligase family protein n=1 Tax=Ideonella sp. BN130291 TaxID=3112940 RepID=UPI002E25440A|nr:O-antigen ligase family protein [Ideonella sp. BN130291]